MASGEKNIFSGLSRGSGQIIIDNSAYGASFKTAQTVALEKLLAQNERLLALLGLNEQERLFVQAALAGDESIWMALADYREEHGEPDAEALRLVPYHRGLKQGLRLAAQVARTTAEEMLREQEAAGSVRTWTGAAAAARAIELIKLIPPQVDASGS